MPEDRFPCVDRRYVEQLRSAALDLVRQVQSTLLTKDAILVDFPLATMGRLLELLDPDWGMRRAGRKPNSLKKSRQLMIKRLGPGGEEALRENAAAKAVFDCIAPLMADLIDSLDPERHIDPRDATAIVDLARGRDFPA